MKKLMLTLAMGALVATGAFADLSFGLTGVQYFEEDANGNLPSVSEAWDNLKDGTGVYYGGFIEITGKHMGLGASFNLVPDPIAYSTYSMMDFDVNVYLSYHLFSAHSFIDPFVTFGIGMRAYDYSDKESLISDLDDYYGIGAGEYYVSKDSPLYASMYWDLGFGLGVNLGGIGVFVKGVYNMNLDGVLTGTAGPNGYYYEPAGIVYSANEEYEILPWIVSPFKWVFGAKINLY